MKGTKPPEPWVRGETHNMAFLWLEHTQANTGMSKHTQSYCMTIITFILYLDRPVLA